MKNYARSYNFPSKYFFSSKLQIKLSWQFFISSLIRDSDDLGSKYKSSLLTSWQVSFYQYQKLEYPSQAENLIYSGFVL